MDLTWLTPTAMVTAAIVTTGGTIYVAYRARNHPAPPTASPSPLPPIGAVLDVVQERDQLSAQVKLLRARCAKLDFLIYRMGVTARVLFLPAFIFSAFAAVRSITFFRSQPDWQSLYKEAFSLEIFGAVSTFIVLRFLCILQKEADPAPKAVASKSSQAV